VITGEGANLGAGPVSISDKAGNIGSGSVSGIKIDRAPPTITGATVNDEGTPRSPNAAGWFNSAVRVRFTCDSQPPQTTGTLDCTKKNGYCRGNKATVELTATDQAGLSGVKQIIYSLNGTDHTVAGAIATVEVPLNGSGHATVSYRAVDNAGNAETPGAVEIDYDTTAPAVTHTLTPTPNAAEWNKSDVLVHFDAQDDPGGSGLDTASVTPDQTVSTETAGIVVNGSADDLAGNTGTDTVTVKLDKTAPTISGAARTSPNGNGWYSGPLTVHFTCSDGLSGIATCPADVVLSTNGANQSASAAATDNANNAASATVGGINIDSVKPLIALNRIANGGIYTLGAVPAPSCSATNNGGSGLAGSCNVNVTGGQPNGVGTFSFTATATDNAGNTTTQTGSYKVIYRWDGFLQPINDTAHQTDQNFSVFKAGSTVPAKFQLKKADGTVVQANSLAPVADAGVGEPDDGSGRRIGVFRSGLERLLVPLGCDSSAVHLQLVYREGRLRLLLARGGHPRRRPDLHGVHRSQVGRSEPRDGAKGAAGCSLRHEDAKSSSKSAPNPALNPPRCEAYDRRLD